MSERSYWPPFRQRLVPLAQCVTYLGFSFAPDGWHPLRAAAEDVLAGEREYAETALAAHYAGFQPKTVAEAHGLGAEIAPFTASLRASDAIHVYPWTLSVRRLARPECQHFGPAPHDGPRHFARQAALVASIRKHGYVRRPFSPGPARGHWLRADGQTRFLLLGGQHRAGALAALGHTEIGARSIGGIDIEHVKSWPRVRSGQMSQSEAEALFMQYFVLDGSERAPRTLPATASAHPARNPADPA